MYALITGASSGIGKAFAKKFAQMGYDLIITGRRLDLLNHLSETISNQYNVQVKACKIELSDHNQLENFIHFINDFDIEVLVNNAGFGFKSRFLDEDLSIQVKMVGVHVLTPMRLIHAVLPGMLRRNKGIIINVSSISANTPLSAGVVYAATKSFLKHFTESLYLENIKSNVVFQSLCPGFTISDFHKRVNGESNNYKNKGIVRWMTSDEVVEISLRKLKKGKVICIPGFWNRVLWTLADLFPRTLYYKIVSRKGNRERLFKEDQVPQEVEPVKQF